MRKSNSAPPNPLTAALRMLARRAYSVAELRRALERKFPGSTEIPGALARLRELGYLDDKKFAEHYAGTLARQRALGRYRVRRELKSKLVDYRAIEPALERAYEGVDERQLLEQALERRVRTMKLPPTRARLASLCQSLLRRGFRADDIMKAVRQRAELRPVSDKVHAANLEDDKC